MTGQVSRREEAKDRAQAGKLRSADQQASVDEVMKGIVAHRERVPLWTYSYVVEQPRSPTSLHGAGYPSARDRHYCFARSKSLLLVSIPTIFSHFLTTSFRFSHRSYVESMRMITVVFIRLMASLSSSEPSQGQQHGVLAPKWEYAW